MLEKLLLAVFLTFALTLFAKMGWSSTSQTTVEGNLQNHPVLTLTQRAN